MYIFLYSEHGNGCQTLYGKSCHEWWIKSLGFDVTAQMIVIIIGKLLQHKNVYMYVYIVVYIML